MSCRQRQKVWSCLLILLRPRRNDSCLRAERSCRPGQKTRGVLSDGKYWFIIWLILDLFASRQAERTCICDIQINPFVSLNCAFFFPSAVPRARVSDRVREWVPANSEKAHGLQYYRPGCNNTNAIFSY